MLYIRPEEVTIAVKDGDLPKTSVRNQLTGTIIKMVPFGPFVRTTIDFGSPLTALVTRRSADELGLTVGMTVIAGVKATAIHVLPDTSSKILILPDQKNCDELNTIIRERLIIGRCAARFWPAGARAIAFFSKGRAGHSCWMQD
jgi:molybdopterin-binding protein